MFPAYLALAGIGALAAALLMFARWADRRPRCTTCGDIFADICVKCQGRWAWIHADLEDRLRPETEATP